MRARAGQCPQKVGTHTDPLQGDVLAQVAMHHAAMKIDTLEARLDALQAAVIALAAALPPERAHFARRMFLAAVADLEDRHERDHAADAAAAGVVVALLATLDQAGAAAEITRN